jgi:AcrR family transcriptional regulator
MASKVAERKAALREKLVVLAEAKMTEGGLRALKVRDLAKEAGCAVGAIYNHFEDLDALALEVNGRTFLRLGAAVAASVATHRGSAKDRLVAMSMAYMQFAIEQPLLWKALFTIEVSSEGPVPQWYMDALGNLFSHIAEPVAELFPDMDARELDLTVRMLFSSVHGIVLLGIEKRISAVPFDQIAEMITRLMEMVGKT